MAWVMYPVSTFPEETSLASSQVYESPYKETERGQQQVQLHLLRTCRHQGCLTSVGKTELLLSSSPPVLLPLQKREKI
jgi:hypothetical protein